MNNHSKSDAPKPSIAGLLRRSWRQFREEINILLAKSRNLAKTNFDLGQEMVRRDKIGDAIFRFRMSLWFDRNQPEAWFDLGCCYTTLEKFSRAAECFQKALDLNPAYEEAQFMLASVGAESMPADNLPRSMPLGMVTRQFDVLAPSYNDMQLVTLGYRGHNALYQAIVQAVGTEHRDLSVLELGCGTGLCGLLLRQIAAKLVGVDVSTGMLARAADLTAPDGRDIYDELKQQDIQSYLVEAPSESFDIVAAANVFSYLGDIEPVFQAAMRILRPGGLFAFTTDIAPPPGYRLIPGDARFGHSVGYVRELAARCGMNEVTVQETLIYNHTRAQLYIFQRP